MQKTYEELTNEIITLRQQAQTISQQQEAAFAQGQGLDDVSRQRVGFQLNGIEQQIKILEDQRGLLQHQTSLASAATNNANNAIQSFTNTKLPQLALSFGVPQAEYQLYSNAFNASQAVQAKLQQLRNPQSWAGRNYTPQEVDMLVASQLETEAKAAYVDYLASKNNQNMNQFTPTQQQPTGGGTTYIGNPMGGFGQQPNQQNQSQLQTEIQQQINARAQQGGGQSLAQQGAANEPQGSPYAPQSNVTENTGGGYNGNN